MTLPKDHAELSKIYDKLHDDFKIHEIVIERKNFNLPLSEAKSVVDGDVKFVVSINATVLSGKVNNVIIKTIDIGLKGKSGNNWADFKIIYSFQLDKESEYIVKNDNSYTLLPFVNEFLDHIIIATSRGILFTELQGSYLEKTILPLTKPSKIKST